LATNVTLKTMMTVAYRVKADTITGGPDWIQSERYDMNAKADKASSIEDLHVMLQNLMTNEFKLKFHRETKEMPVYALVLDKDGAKMAPHQSSSASEQAGKSWIDISSDPNAFLQVKWHATQSPMDYFVFRLSEIMDRPVINLTKLAGSYDFDVSFTRPLPPGLTEDSRVNGAPIDTSGPTIFEAVRKLGLRLERQKGPVETIVIDHAEKPVLN
jgi:uncharacterized protein (TIGR03435 family)